MGNSVIEAQYPITFREQEARSLGKHLKSRHSVVLIGMKRVGISNFLRFFLYNKDIVPTYIRDGKKHVFIPVDLNDLVETEVFPFWILTFKRIIDEVERLHLSQNVKDHIQALFLDSIQSQDLFLTIDGVRKSLVLISDNNVLPTIFFIRFDRMKNVVTSEFFGNLQGLKDATHQKLVYVFTSFRSLDALAPSVFTKAALGVFSQDMYISPAKHEDTKVIYETYRSRYKLTLPKALENWLFDIVDGYVQYLQLSLIFLHEQKNHQNSRQALFESLLQDERIALQSEELWESLESDEQKVLLKISRGESISKTEKEKTRYLWDTGIVREKNSTYTLFSPLFDNYVQTKETKIQADSQVEFTKKEHLLFNLLKSHVNEICERETIVEVVWPEVEAIGVSDWAIDRLMARVRSKLKLRKNTFEVVTVKTRGYKLIG